jgi:hypothetical protein
MEARKLLAGQATAALAAVRKAREAYAQASHGPGRPPAWQAREEAAAGALAEAEAAVVIGGDPSARRDLSGGRCRKGRPYRDLRGLRAIAFRDLMRRPLALSRAEITTKASGPTDRVDVTAEQISITTRGLVFLRQ